MWNLKSPHGTLQLIVSQDDRKGVFYTLNAGDQTMIRTSRLGLATSLGDLLEGYHYENSRETTIDEQYSLPVSKKAVYTNHANELELQFTVQKLQLSIRFRLFEDGLAFRYEFTGADGDENGNKHENGSQEQAIAIYHEYTEFAFPDSFQTMWLQDWVNTYEGLFNHCDWQSAGRKDYGMPALFHNSESSHWVMLTEAGILNTNGAYCSSHLQSSEQQVMKLAFAPEQLGPVQTSLPLQTPWRVVMVCPNLNEVVNTNLVYNLNPACEWDDLSWIKPARSVWSWWSFENGAQLYSEQKKYVDYAAAMGFEAVTVDAGWDDSWVKELCDYARERSVDIWLWSDMQGIDTLENATIKIARWASWGVVGLKVDFFMNDSQHTMWQYNMIADIMTEHKLMINFHGSTKPAGEGRTYPNIMTAEGIMGLEHYKWSGLPHAVHNCTVPFTRNVIGPMDYTTTGFSNGNRNTTQAHQLALSLVFESGVQHLADSIYSYEPWVGTEFLRRMPAKFDEVKLLSGYPGDHVVMMRRAGQEWFIGGMVTSSRSLTVALDFLPDQEYKVEIYRDGRNRDSVKKEVRTLSNTDQLHILSQESGGFAIYISNGTIPLKEGVHEGYMHDDYQIYDSQEANLLGTAEQVACDNARGEQAVQLGSNGRMTLDQITADRDGRYTLRLFYMAELSSAIQIHVNQQSPQVLMLQSSGGDEVVRASDIVVALQKGMNSISFIRGEATAPRIDYVKVINWAPNEDVYYSVEDGTLAGGAALCRVDSIDEAKKAVGIGKGGSVTFEHVNVDTDGEYIISIDYYSGENRPLMIRVNVQNAIRSVLFNSGGWGPARWDIIATKEVKVRLNKGDNRIRLYNDEEAAPEIARIGIRLEKAGTSNDRF